MYLLKPRLDAQIVVSFSYRTKRMDKRKTPQTAITQFFSKRPRTGTEEAPPEEVVPQTLQTPEGQVDLPLPLPGASQTEDDPIATAGDVMTSAHDENFPTDEYDDVGLLQTSKICDDEKIKLMQNHFRPDKKFEFPVRQHKGKNLRFNLSWLDDFTWLVYSKVKNGGYCLPCVLFARKPEGRGCEFGILIERPFTQFRKALGRKDGVLTCHETLAHHKLTVAAYTERMHVEENPGGRVDVQLENQRENQFQRNKTALQSIIECIIYLGRQGLALRGHRDSSTADPATNRGNLEALIQFRATTDDILRQFMQTCPKNASYVSNTIQNDVLEILGDVMRESITANISDERCPFFSIIADELTDDIANKHILSLCIRFLEYIDGDVNIQEGLLDFAYTERGTAAHLVKVIRSTLIECGLKPSNVRGQSYDTTSAMSSDKQGVQGLFRRDVPRAVYTPCNSHKLNLVIASASKLPQIRNCVAAVNEAHLFFSASHKRQGFFEKVIDILHSRDKQGEHTRQQKLKGLCKTRWVERFEAFDNFIDMAPLVVTTCDIMVNPHLYQQDVEIKALMDEKWNWDGETKNRAQGILGNFGQFETIVSLITLRNVLAPLREITLKLQKRDLDIRTAYSLLSSVQADMDRMRAEVDDRFETWYSEIKKLAEKLGTEEGMRRAKSSVYRATHPADDPKDYFKRAIVIPFIDDVNTQMADRFSDQSVSVVQGFTSLIPAVIRTMELRDIPTVVEKLSEYEPDIDRLASLQTELEIWRGKWVDYENPPASLITALKRCPKDLLPNLHTLLQIGCLIPVTSCEAERSFSAVRRIKSTLRSTMGEERLSALVLLNTYRRIRIDTEDVVRRFIKKKPRRLFSKLHEWHYDFLVVACCEHLRFDAHNPS